MLQKAGHIKNTVVLIFRRIQCLNLMISGEAWVLLSSGSQVQPQIMLDPDYPPDYLSASYDYDSTDHDEKLQDMKFHLMCLHIIKFVTKLKCWKHCLVSEKKHIAKYLELKSL